jgi:hypothetical protein
MGMWNWSGREGGMVLKGEGDGVGNNMWLLAKESESGCVGFLAVTVVQDRDG